MIITGTIIDFYTILPYSRNSTERARNMVAIQTEDGVFHGTCPEGILLVFGDPLYNRGITSSDVRENLVGVVVEFEATLGTQHTFNGETAYGYKRPRDLRFKGHDFAIIEKEEWNRNAARRRDIMYKVVCSLVNQFRTDITREHQVWMTMVQGVGNGTVDVTDFVNQTEKLESLRTEKERLEKLCGGGPIVERAIEEIIG